MFLGLDDDHAIFADALVAEPEQPLAHRFGLMLWIKIALAASVFGHFVTAMALRRRGKLHSGHFRRIHLSVFAHVVCIVLLAKWMFYAG